MSNARGSARGGDMGILGIDSYIRDRSFVMGRGGGGFWGAIRKFSSLKGGPSQKLKAEEGFYR